MDNIKRTNGVYNQGPTDLIITFKKSKDVYILKPGESKDFLIDEDDEIFVSVESETQDIRIMEFD